MTRIHLMTGPHDVESFDLDTETIYVGRGPENDIEVKDRYVSRRHLKIVRKGNRFFVRDLESKNGTFVDGQLLASGVDVEMAEGVPIVIGMTVLSVGEECSEDVLSFLSSMEMKGEMGTEEDDAFADRPMTAQRNLELISRVSSVFKETSDVKEILRKILYYIFQLLKRIDRGIILLIDQETGKISEAVSRARKELDSRVVKYDFEVVNQVIKDGESVIVSDVPLEDDDDLPDTFELNRIKSVMCVPLISKSKVIGVIYVDSIRRAHGFRKEDLALFRVLSNRAAMALEGVQLGEGQAGMPQG